MTDLDELAERSVAQAGPMPPTMEWIRHRSGQRRRRRAAVRIAVAVPALLLVGGLGLWATMDDPDDPGVIASTEDPSPSDDPEAVAVPPTCVGDAWQTVEVGQFRFLLPPELVDQEAQGIDSLVGQYRSDELEVFFDYGVFSSDFSELDRFEPVEEVIVVDGREGRLIVADVSSSDGEWESDFITALHVPLDAPEGWTSAALSMWFAYDDETLASVAGCVATTVDFTPDGSAAVPDCSAVDAFTEEFRDTGFVYDRGPASANPAQHVATSEGVIVGRLVGAEPRVDHDRSGVAIIIDVEEVLSQSDGPTLSLGTLAVNQEFSPQLIDGELEDLVPIGARVVAFMYHTEQLPDGWGFDLEGLWIDCEAPGGRTIAGDIIRSEGWDHIETLDDLVAEIRDVAG